ncbi:MAG: hypothetical protein JXR60_05760 [Bacteroidales bacterium]|nr:hypothetical protein [Bacteroidales bacterium]
MEKIWMLVVLFLLMACANPKAPDNQQEVLLLHKADTNLYTGKIVGYYVEIDQKKYEEFYDKGIKSGVYRSWFKNGYLKMTGRYQNDKRVGVWKWYDEKGQLKYMLDYNRS